jgi:hypothetical protein
LGNHWQDSLKLEQITDLKYWTENKKAKQSMVHVHRLKCCMNPEAFQPQERPSSKQWIMCDEVTEIPKEEEGEQEYTRSLLILINPAEIEPLDEDLPHTQPLIRTVDPAKLTLQA